MENSSLQSSKRRKFIKQAMTFVLSASAFPVIAGDTKDLFKKPEKTPPLPADLVFEFVKAAHVDLTHVIEMLAKEPMLVNACWDWGGGDFETGLGGASHMGNREIATYLLQNGARKDIFYAAMSGDKQLVKSFIKSNPDIANVYGPHKYSLLYHVAISGDTHIANIVRPHISRVAIDSNKALHAAAREGHLSMTKWLLKNGVDDPNTLDIFGNTPLQTAEKKGYKEAVILLKKYGGK